MKPLLFVNWRQLSSRFTVLMWMLACVLAIIVLMHVPGGAAPVASSAHSSPVAGKSMAAQPTRLRH
jgi:hypothetical protein